MTDNRYANDLPGRRRARRVRPSIDGELPPVDSGEAGRGLARLATVWTQATAHAVFDTVGVVNQLAADMTDTLIDGLAPGRPGSQAAAPIETRPRRVPMLTQMSDSFTWAVQDAADVIARSAEQFNRASRTGENVPPAESSSAARSGTTSSAPPASPVV